MLSFVPTPLITVIIARATPAAIRPYSMAVAAFSSFKNLMTKRNGRSEKSPFFMLMEAHCEDVKRSTSPIGSTSVGNFGRDAS